MKNVKLLPLNMIQDAEGLIDNLRLQIEILKGDNDELRTERNLYKKLFEDEIALHYGHNSKRGRGKTNPVFLNWMKYKIARED